MTAVQKLLDQISDPSTKAAHSELCFRHARDAANKATAVAPFAVTPTEALTLERLGITTSPFATTSHTHSADKILENDCMQIIGHYLPSDPVTFIQLKRSKLHLLKRGPDRDFLVNYCHEPKDVLRYGLLNPNSCPTVSTTWAFLSDTLHFMSTRQLANLFLQNDQLCLLFATLVLPIEALHRLPSLFPDVYKLEYYDKHFAYMPGGHGGGAYVHSYETLKWLSTGQIGTHISKHLPIGQMDYLTLEKVETKAAHHIMLIQRRRTQVAWPLPEVWVFQASDYVKLPPIFYPEKANVQGTYPHNLIKRLQAYCFSVKAVSLRDIFAKLRQVIETNDLQRYSMADLIRLANYLLFTTGMQQVSDYESFLTKGFLARLSANIRMRIRELMQGITGQASYTALLSVADVIPVHFTTRPICRPTQGADWFQPPQEREKPLPLPPLNQQASPEDLDLLAEFEELQRMEQNQQVGESSHETPCTAESDNEQRMNDTESPETMAANAATETGHESTPQATPGTATDPDAPIIEDTDDEESMTLDENDFAEYDAMLEGVVQRPPEPAEAIASSNQGIKLEERAPKPSEPQGCTTKRVACTCGLALEVWRKKLTKFIPVGPGDPAKSRECWFYSRNGEAYSYTGHRHESRGWPDTLDALLKESGANPEEYQHCLVQKYQPGAKIPHHKDNESCYPRGHKILTINQEGLGEFTISCKRGGAQLSLDTGSYFTMPPFMQDTHTHAVHAQTERVSLTFRQTCIAQGSSKLSHSPQQEGTHKITGPHHHPSKPVREPSAPRIPESTTPTPPPTTTPPANGVDATDTQAGSQTSNARSEFDQRTTTILKLHGFTAMREQHDGTNPIKPVFFNEKVASLKLASHAKHSPTQQVMANMAKELHRSFYAYRVDNKRATAYMSDIKNNLTGLVLPKLDRDKLSAWVSLCEVCVKTVRLLVIHGAGGAGKSRALQETMRALGDSVNDINVVVPTVNLVTDWKKKMPEVDPKRFMTFEKACEREGREIVIFDDYGKLPAGYIDAYLAIKPTVEMVILTGDQRQSTYHNQNKDAQTANLPANTTHFSHYCDYYINATHRQPRRLANPIMVHAERQLGGAVKQASIIPETATVLVPSFKTQTTLSDLGRHALTYSGCQGLTIPHVSIVLDNDTPLCSNEVLYTAFSRASETITFINTHSDNPEFLAKLDCTPYLKTLISGVREEEDAGKDERPEEPEVREPLVKTHIPVANEPIQLEQKIEAMEDKDTRELWVHDEKTNLMQTQDPVIQLFPHQQAKDEALFKRTIEERIRTASPEDNAKSIASTINGGDLLFEAYAQFMKVPKEPERFDRRLWLHCTQLAMRTYLSKPKANLQQGAARQDPDFPANAIALFNKSQWVKKLEKVGFKFKAGQTISAFKQSTVLLTTTMALYLRKKREAHQPDNVFIMCEKTPDQFNTFVVNKWDFSRQSYTSDYSQYDQSQDATFLNFELRKARHFGIPEEVVQFYKFIKTHAKTFVGNLAVMRLSGEGPTFDANTECNIAYDALRFQLDDSVMACYAGDDLVRDKVCPERPGWRYSEPLFKLTAKPLATNKPDFCGWRLTPYGIVKSPIQLYQSLKLAIALGKMEEVKRSYALDYMFAFKLGDRLYDVFDEEELEKHQRVTRTMIKAGVKPPPSGSHMPVFHITSDRLIKNPHYKEMSDETSDRVLLVAPIIHDDYVPTSFN